MVTDEVTVTVTEYFYTRCNVTVDFYTRYHNCYYIFLYGCLCSAHQTSVARRSKKSLAGDYTWKSIRTCAEGITTSREACKRGTSRPKERCNACSSNFNYSERA